MENNVESIKEEFYNQFLKEVEIARKNIIKINNQIKEEKAAPEEIDVSLYDMNKTRDKKYELYRKISELQEQIKNHGESPLVKSWENELSINKNELEKVERLIEKLEMPKSKRIEMLEKQKQEEIRVPKIKVDNLIKSTQIEITQSENTYRDLEQKLKERTKLYMNLELPQGETSRKNAFPEYYEACKKIGDKLKTEKSKLIEKYKKLDTLKEIKERIESFLMDGKVKGAEQGNAESEEIEPASTEPEISEQGNPKQPTAEPSNNNPTMYRSLMIDDKSINYLDEEGRIVAVRKQEDLTQEHFIEILEKNHLLGFKDLNVENLDKNIVNAFSEDQNSLSKYLSLIEENTESDKEEIASSLMEIEYDLSNLMSSKDMDLEEKLKIYQQAKKTRNLFKELNSKNGKIIISVFDKIYLEIQGRIRKNSKKLSMIPETIDEETSNDKQEFKDSVKVDLPDKEVTTEVIQPLYQEIERD